MQEFKTEFGPNTISLYKDGVQAAYLEYEIQEGVLNIKKTIVREKYQGQGLAKTLRGLIIEKAKKEGYSLTADCSYAAHYLKKNHYSD